MSRCLHCGKILPDDWLISEAASMMGKRGSGAKKARPSNEASAAARASWRKRRKKKK